MLPCHDMIQRAFQGGRGWVCSRSILSPYFFPCAGIQNLLHSLQKLSPRLEGRTEDLQFLQNLVKSNEFHSLIQVLTITVHSTPSSPTLQSVNWSFNTSIYSSPSIPFPHSSHPHLTCQVHHEVSVATSSSSNPACTNALTLCHSLAYDIETSTHPETQELFDLLTSPHIDVSTV